MKRVTRITICGLLLCTGAAFATASLDAAPQKRGKKHQPVAAGTGTHVSVQVVFSPREVQILREHYTPRSRSLPPGLQKKYRRTGQLPPGWQKKFEPFPSRLERQLVVLPAGYSRGVIDGHAIIFNRRSQVIVDLAALF